MLVYDTEGKLKKRQMSFSIPKSAEGNFIACGKNEDGTASLYFIEAHKGSGYIVEDAVFGNGTLLKRNEKISEKIEDAYIRKAVWIKGSMEMLRNAYGEAMYVGFNRRDPVTVFQLQDILSREDPSDIEELPLPEIDVILNLGRTPATLTAASVHTSGRDVMIRIFSGADGLVWEHSRICMDADGSRFYYKKNGRFYEDHSVTQDAMDFSIAAADDLTDTRMEYIFDRDSRNLCCALLSGGLENLKKMDYENIKYAVFHEIGDGSFVEHIDKLLGGADWEAKTFAKMSGIPQHLLQCFEDRKGEIWHIPWYKNVFREMLSSMDAELFGQCMDLAINAVCRNGEYIRKVLTNLCAAGSPKQFTSYAQFLIECGHSSAQKELYAQYIKMLAENSLEQDGFHWKVKAQDVEREHERAKTLVQMREDMEVKDKYSEMFKSRRRRWQRFTYKGSLYVVAPKGPIDILHEGRKLHHCVGNYMDDLAEGKSIIMFLRKPGDLDTPYYTLEIRRNRIAQCFGMKNCPIDDELDAFLREYCEKKKVHYTDLRGAQAGQIEE